jgi:hypothetical protein
MKKYILSLFVTISLSSLGQVENATEFVDFALMDSHNKASYMGSEWNGLGTDRKVEDGNVIEDLYYSRVYREQKYFLTLRNILNTNTGVTSYLTMVAVDNESIFNDWMKELKDSGIDLVKDPEGGEKWIAPNESYYTIYFEKRKVKDIWVYEISVII